MLALNQSATSLAHADKLNTEEALRAIEATLSEVHDWYMGLPTTFKYVFSDGGASALLRVIDSGIKAQQHNMERMLRGEWSKNDKPQDP
jgi:hypothetical protein